MMTIYTTGTSKKATTFLNNSDTHGERYVCFIFHNQGGWKHSVVLEWIKYKHLASNNTLKTVRGYTKEFQKL